MEETNDAMLLLDPGRERLVDPKVQGLLPCNPERTPGGSFARQEVLQVWEPACSPQRRGSQDPIARGPGSCLARTWQNRHPKRVLERVQSSIMPVNQPIGANLNININIFLW